MRGRLFGFLTTVWIFAAAAATAAETVVIPGTGDSQRLLQALARAYEAARPGGEVEIPPSVGSIGGLRRVLDGSRPLARIARPLSGRETGQGLKSRVFAHSPVVFVANLPSSCVEDLSPRQVVDIYAGRITSWGQLGPCGDRKIYVANREDGDSCRRLLGRTVPGFDRIGRFAGETIYGTPLALAIIERHPYTVGYLPLAMAVGTPLKRLRYDGVEPTPENVRSGAYPLAVPLALAWRGELKGAARDFVDFLFTPEARRIILEHGSVPAN